MPGPPARSGPVRDGLPGSIVRSGDADLALDAVVMDVAAADGADAEVALHLVGRHVPGCDRAHRHVAPDVARNEIARADGLGLHATAHSVDFRVTGCNRVDRNATLDVAQAEIARTDIAGMGIAANTIHFHVAGAHAGEIHAADVARDYVARTHLQPELPGDTVHLEVAGAETGLQRSDTSDIGVARTFFQLDGHGLRHPHVELQVCVGPTEQRDHNV